MVAQDDDTFKLADDELADIMPFQLVPDDLQTQHFAVYRDDHLQTLFHEGLFVGILGWRVDEAELRRICGEHLTQYHNGHGR